MNFHTNLFKILFVIFTVVAWQSAARAEETEKETNTQNLMTRLAEQALVGSSIKTILDYIEKTRTLGSAEENIKAIDALMEYRRYSSTENLKQTVLQFNNIDDSAWKLSIGELAKVKKSKTSVYNKYAELRDGLDKLGFAVDVLSLATSMYDFSQSFGDVTDQKGRIVESRESYRKAGKSLLDAYQASVGVASFLAKYVPSDTWVKWWGNNALATGFKGSAVNALGAITTGAQIESMIYQHYRDGHINDIKGNVFSGYKTTKESRDLVFSRLNELYIERENAGEEIGAGEIDNILGGYSIHNPSYSGFSEGPYVLSEMFNKRVRDSNYLNTKYQNTNFSELPNITKIYVALDALIEISAIEDADVLAYLQKTVREGKSVADVIFSALEGSDVYKIYDTKSLIERMFLYYDSKYSAVDYYELIYKAVFTSNVAIYKQYQLIEFGKEARRLKEASELKQQRDDEFSRLLEVPETKVGDKVAVTFGLEVDYRDEIIKAAALNKPFRFTYLDDEGMKTVDANYDSITGRLIFSSPATRLIKLYEILMPQAPWWNSDTKERYYEYKLPIGNNGVSVSILNTENADDGSCPQDATNLACTIGVYSKKINSNIFSNLGTVHSFLVKDDVGYIAYDQGIRVFDLNKNKKIVDKKISQTIYNMIFFNDYVYALADSSDGNYLLILSRANNEDISLISETKIGDYRSNGHKIKLINNKLYVSSNDTKVIDVSSPSVPAILKSYSFGGQFFTVNNNFLYAVSTYMDGWLGDQCITALTTINLETDESNRQEIYRTRSPCPVFREIIIDAGYLYVPMASDFNGIKNPILQFSLVNPAMPSLNNVITDISFDSVIAHLGESKYLVLTNNSMVRLVNMADFSMKNTSISIRTNSTMAMDALQLYHTPYSGELWQYDFSNFEFNDKYVNDSVILNKNFDERVLIYRKDFYLSYLRLNGQVSSYDLRDYQGNILSTVEANGYYPERASLNSDSVGDFMLFVNHDAEKLKLLDISNKKNPNVRFEIPYDRSMILDSIAYGDNVVCLGYRFDDGQRKVHILDANSGILLGKVAVGSGGAIRNMHIENNILHIVKTNFVDSLIVDSYDIKNPSLPEMISSSSPINFANGNVAFSENKIFIVGNERQGNYFGKVVIHVYNIKDGKPVLINEGVIPSYSGGSMLYDQGYLYLGDSIFDLTQNGKINYIGSIEELKNKPVEFGFASQNKLSFISESNGYSDSMEVFSKKDIIEKARYLFGKNYPAINIQLTSETPYDYDGEDAAFNKTWIFSNEISNYAINVLSNDYSPINNNSFSISGNKLSVTLTPTTTKPINKLTLSLTTSDGRTVKINGSDTFWAVSRTNNAPRLADGQPSQMAGKIGQPTSMLVNTFDEDGDEVAISIADNDGGYVLFDPDNPKKLVASFNDAKTVHTVKIALSDGKEVIEQDITVLRFDETSIQNFYSDVDPHSVNNHFSDIAFATLQGIFSGQPSESDPQKRIFRPTDNASMAETLSVILKTGMATKRLTMESSPYYLRAYPNWSSPYYTYAREHGAVGDLGGDLSILYPTREELAQILVKTLELDKKLVAFDSIAADFADKASFSNDAMHSYGQIAKVFGLFMAGEQALPQQKVTRAELAGIVRKIFMMPSAEVVLSANPVEQGDKFSISLANIKASKVSSTYGLQDNESALKSDFAINRKRVSPSDIDSFNLNIGDNQIVAMIDNEGVRDIIFHSSTVSFIDNDLDGVQNRYDKWMDNPDYGYDSDNDGLPDVWEEKYGLNPLNTNDAIADKDSDGLSNLEEFTAKTLPDNADTDGDGVDDKDDEAPTNNQISKDTDKDGVQDGVDNCPAITNPDQADKDSDGIGDTCDTRDDTDSDADGVRDAADNCPTTANPDQADKDSDGIGDVCDTTDNACTLDIDGNGQAKALTDGLLTLRYLFNFRDAALINKAVASDAKRKTAADISTYLEQCKTNFDIDGNGQAKALTDGLLILRYQFNFRGNALVNKAIAADATRKTATDIEPYLQRLYP